MIHVRPNGGGQLQQQIEGVSVASIVGQSVLVIPATSAGGGIAAPPNRAGQPSVATGRATTQSPTPSGVVASGVIQLVDSGTNAGQVPNNGQAPAADSQKAPTSQRTDTGADPTAPLTSGAGNPLPPSNRN